MIMRVCALDDGYLTGKMCSANTQKEQFGLLYILAFVLFKEYNICILNILSMFLLFAGLIG